MARDLDYAGKRVAVIGSGATAMTLVPAMTDRAEHVTMVQRTPTWVVSAPSQDPIANALRKVLPNGLAFELTRQKNRRFGEYVYRQTRTNPDRVRRRLLSELAKHLPQEQIDAHFTPSYNPWDQRVCLAADADLFEAISTGKADVVTDTIDRFTETGLQLDSGTHIDADIIVTATGLNLVTIGEMDLDIDGEKIDFSELWTYKGLGYSEIPNLISIFGYINASWTLRADLIVEYGWLLPHAQHRHRHRHPVSARAISTCRRPFIDDFPAGYAAANDADAAQAGRSDPWLQHPIGERGHEAHRQGTRRRRRHGFRLAEHPIEHLGGGVPTDRRRFLVIRRRDGPGVAVVCAVEDSQRDVVQPLGGVEVSLVHLDRLDLVGGNTDQRFSDRVDAEVGVTRVGVVGEERWMPHRTGRKPVRQFLHGLVHVPGAETEPDGRHGSIRPLERISAALRSICT